MNTSYAEVYKDLTHLYPEKHIHSNPDSLHALHATVSRSKWRPIPPLSLSDMSSELGQSIVRGFSAIRHPSYNGPLHQVCIDSEQFLIESIDPEHVIDDELYSPTLLTYNDEVVGIHKDVGDPTVYSLEDVPELEMAKGCFYMLPDQKKPKLYGESDRVRRATLEPQVPIRYLRASTLLVPLAFRLPLSPSAFVGGDILTLSTSHDTLRQHAANALAKAVEIELKIPESIM